MSGTNDLIAMFNDAMLDIYDRAKHECKYNAVRFLQMIDEYGELDTQAMIDIMESLKKASNIQ